MSTPHLLAGVAAAVAASVLFNWGLALQAGDARSVGAGGGLGLARRLVQRRAWLAGTVLTIVGWPFQVLALALAPLVVVEPALAVGLVVLLVLGARALDEPVGLREVALVLAIAATVAVIALAAPGRSTHVAGAQTLFPVLGILTAATLLPQLRRGLGSRVAMIAAGVGFALGALTTKLAADALARHDWPGALAWVAATGLSSGAGLLDEMQALQGRAAVEVGPVGLALQTLVPVACAPVLFGERLGSTPLHGVVLLGGVVALVSAAVALSRSPAVVAWADATSAGSATAVTPAACTEATSRSSAASPAGEPSTVATSTSPGRGTR